MKSFKFFLTMAFFCLLQPLLAQNGICTQTSCAGFANGDLKQVYSAIRNQSVTVSGGTVALTGTANVNVINTVTSSITGNVNVVNPIGGSLDVNVINTPTVVSDLSVGTATRIVLNATSTRTTGSTSANTCMGITTNTTTNNLSFFLPPGTWQLIGGYQTSNYSATINTDAIITDVDFNAGAEGATPAVSSAETEATYAQLRFQLSTFTSGNYSFYQCFTSNSNLGFDEKTSFLFNGGKTYYAFFVYRSVAAPIVNQSYYYRFNFVKISN